MVMSKSKNKADNVTGSEGGRRPTGDPVTNDTEVVVTPNKKRRLTRAYKLSVLSKVDELKQTSPEAVGEYLRSEGLYYNAVTKWRYDQLDGSLSGYKKGSKAQIKESMSSQNAKLKRQLASSQKKLKQAELLIELQKKISQLILGGTPEGLSE
jgi:transposase